MTLINYGKVRAARPAWLWPGYLPGAPGDFTIVDGYPAAGKSHLVLDLAARITTGAPWPDGKPNTAGPRNVLLLGGEDDPASVVKPRLLAAGARPGGVFAWSHNAAGQPIELPRDAGELEAVLRRHRIGVVIADPFLAVFDAPSRDAATRRALEPITAALRTAGATLLAVRHPTKAGRGPAMYRGAGAVALVARSRAAYLVARNPEDPDTRVFACADKLNGGPIPPSLAYRIVKRGRSSAVQWLGTTPMTADDLIDTGGSDRAEAVRFLSSLLAGGPVAAADVRKAGTGAGISWATLRRAQAALGIKPRKGPGGAWSWDLPTP